jgi:hypothetical protein
VKGVVLQRNESLLLVEAFRVVILGEQIHREYADPLAASQAVLRKWNRSNRPDADLDRTDRRLDDQGGPWAMGIEAARPDHPAEDDREEKRRPTKRNTLVLADGDRGRRRRRGSPRAHG